MMLSTFDTLILAFAAMAFGFILLLKGGNWTIDGAGSLAERWGVSPAVIGFTIVGFGTSLPELLVSLKAVLSGYPGLSLGNVVGSNIANILLIAGITATIAAVKIKRGSVTRDIAMMVFATLILLGAAWDGMISRQLGGGMIVLVIAYVVYALMKKKDKDDVANLEDDIHHLPPLKATLALVGGLIGVALGAEVLVRGAVVTANIFGVPEAVIGLTIVAFGTSVPELSVSIIAAKKKQTAMVIGNVLGSNVFNILSILGITALVQPLMITPETISLYDVFFMTAVTGAFALLLILRSGISRFTGALMLLAYCTYIGWSYTSSL